MDSDFYEVLELEPSATPEEIKEAFYRLSKLYHPDMETGDKARFQEIQAAYEILSDPETRRKYDNCEPLTRLDPEAALNTILEMMFDDIVNDCPDDIIEYIEEEYQKNADAVHVRTKELETELKKYTDFSKRVKDAEVNQALRRLLRSKIRGVKQNIYVEKKKLEVYSEVRSLLLGLEIDPIPDPFDPRTSSHGEIHKRVLALMGKQGFSTI